MGYCSDLDQQIMENGMTSFLEEFCSAGKPVSFEDSEETYLASYEAYQEELADRSKRTVDQRLIVKVKIARFLERRQAKGVAWARIAELRAKSPNRSRL